MKLDDVSMHALIERKMLPKIIVALVVSLMVRGSFVFTNGAVDLFHVPVLGGVLLVVTGLSIAGVCELLMVAAGRDFTDYRRQFTFTRRRQDMSEDAREAQLEDLRGAVLMSKTFMFVGLAASLFSGVWFLLGLSGVTLQAAVIDGVSSAVTVLAILFFVALRREHVPDPAERIEEAANAAMVGMVSQAASQLASLAATDGGGHGVLAATLMRSLGPQMRARYAPVMALLAPPAQDVTYWTMAQCYFYAGATGRGKDTESRKRQVRRLLSRVEGYCSLGPDGGRLVPRGLAMEVLGDMHDVAMARPAALDSVVVESDGADAL